MPDSARHAIPISADFERWARIYGFSSKGASAHIETVWKWTERPDQPTAMPQRVSRNATLISPMREIPDVSSKKEKIRAVTVSESSKSESVPSTTPRNAQKKTTNAQTDTIDEAELVTACVKTLAKLPDFFFLSFGGE